MVTGAESKVKVKRCKLYFKSIAAESTMYSEALDSFTADDSQRGLWATTSPISSAAYSTIVTDDQMSHH